jgi:hypothetical protein
LQEPNFRRYFVGRAISVAGTLAQWVAQDRLVPTLTDRGVALDLSAVLQFGPVLLRRHVGRHGRRSHRPPTPLHRDPGG